jgi:Uma2 family endonuclease
MGATTTRLTYEAYVQSEETNLRYDIVDGEVSYMSPAPDYIHQRISKTLFLALNGFVVKEMLGEVLYAPLDILISRKPLRTRQPDLMFISKARTGIIQQRVEGAPDLVVEILSPGNTGKKLQTKLEDYALLGVPEVWEVERQFKTLEVLVLEKGKYRSAGITSPGSAVNSRVLPGFVLPAGVFD